ncbi:MAG: O-antigen ligase family protein [Proteobacteria bacterium]|nr:O-antigen ligase family protein [Pseudomonadota bacterium]
MTRSPDGSGWIYALFLGLLLWAPVPLGSNRPWSWALLEVGVLLLGVAWLVGFARGKFDAGRVLVGAWPAAACFAVWLAYVWLQLLPLPVELLRLVSPESARWHIAASVPDALSFAPLTLDRHGTLDAACKSTAYFVYFLLALVLLQDRDRVRLATYAVILSGTFQALYGAFASLQGGGMAAAGTFVNRNHYAAYMVMCLSVGIGVLMASLSGTRYRSWGEFFREAVQWVITPKMGLRLLLVAMVIALVLTRSRMGNGSFFISLFATGVIGLVLSKHATKSMVVLLVSLIAIDVFIVGAYFGTQRVVESIGHTTLQTEDRDEVAGYALRMWRDFPVFGSGLGSFPVVFPRYSAEGTLESYTHAHNDYLELAAETGLLGIGLLGLLVSFSFAAALRAQQLRKDPVMRGISFAAMMGIIALMIHSTVDFNLQIPANALTFVLLLAFAWASRHCGEGQAQPGD